ncbi:MAG: NADH-quinone oxidoreductase subunit C [Armatimonadetes bacterium]|nr:NADH-quinone oxidoreductase subunit C [Armatimonadota bacterium]PIU64012.1 MAG: NADH-quinone oxidoreductase subunit C [Armatimonadetes bacterium CG07_land_8_20_14_0_80_59_28]PIX40739.1 MAG: NADH-quinone oxidoreductase subunit C [Armatimonadetes bacterium CG_4_8_14_3_um_filter_58_9]PIY42994.1 MAG: NADH-quinone oxidoreductase subunit C [Armatimonadetes bacterium CG_4_10_14_3_um_filter_59_10]PJB74629.1 MAG: NADH-quinone oxidoreductase subunit C [Armatimonadetes bacterium CG_4_9_14_3_um_filter_5
MSPEQQNNAQAQLPQVDGERPALGRLHQQFPEAILASHSYRGDDTISVAGDSLLPIMQFLRETPELSFETLMDLTAVDYLKMGKSPRFEVVYHLYSLTHNHRLRVKVPLPEDLPEVDSLTSLWKIADWYEREVWDMFGIKFRGHPDLRRLLMYEEFEGHPLRKDYPKSRRQPIVAQRT